MTYRTFWFIVRKTENNSLQLPVATTSLSGGSISGILFEKEVNQQD
jgi:hypothetical protein